MSKLQYWKELPPNPDYERVGRILQNAFDQDETVVMERRFWKHFDWLEQQGHDMVVWVKNADFDRHRPEYMHCLASELMASMALDEKRRFLSNVTCPMYIKPEGWDDPRHKFEIPERLATDNEWFDRPLKNMFGLEVAISMPGKYWRYYDWLASRNADLERFAIEADMEAKRIGKTLSQEMMRGLRVFEKDSYLKGENHPLFLSGSGYSDRDFRDGGRRMMEAVTANDIEREFKDEGGTVLNLGMPKRYWQYFDWLARNGHDMDLWVQTANVSRFRKDGVELSLRGEAMLALKHDEARRFRSDEPSPLFINPDGYNI